MSGIKPEDIINKFQELVVNRINSGIRYGTDKLPLTTTSESSSRTDQLEYLGGPTSGRAHTLSADTLRGNGEPNVKTVFDAVLNEARLYSVIRPITWQRRFHYNKRYLGRRYYHTGPDEYKIDQTVTGKSYTNRAGIPVADPTNRRPSPGSDLSMAVVESYMRALWDNFQTSYNQSSETITVEICHSSCHESCHTSRSRR